MNGTDLLVPTERGTRPAAGARLSVREDTLYTDHKGKEKKSLRKRTTQILSQLEEPLRMLLEPGEVILYVAPGQAPVTLFEQMAFGWYVLLMTRTALVFTDRRLLRLAIDGKSRWKRAVKVARWGDVKQAKVPGALFPTRLRLEYLDGGKEAYWGLKPADGRKIRSLVEQRVREGGGQRSAAGRMASLCPACASTLTPGEYRCARCGLAFKDESTMLRRSIVIPGGGYFYAGHWFLGLGDFVAEFALLALLILQMAAALTGAPQASPDGGAAVPASEAWTTAGILAALLAFEKWMTIHHCRRFVRDFIPLRTDFHPSRRA